MPPMTAHATGDLVVLAAEDDHRRDRARPGQQRRRERDERDVRDLAGAHLGIVLAAQHLERDEQQQQAARDRERVHRHVQVVEHEPAEQREADDQPAGREDGADGGAAAFGRCERAVIATKIGAMPTGSMSTAIVTNVVPSISQSTSPAYSPIA